MPPMGKAVIAFVVVGLFLTGLAGDGPQHLILGIAWGRVITLAAAISAAIITYRTCAKEE